MSDNTKNKRRQTAGFGDIRVIIGSLMGIYGVILTIMGIAMTEAKANLWAGVGLLVVCALLLLWNTFSPTYVDESGSDAGGSTGDRS
ncbi:hypothetical protein [Acidipropionibacterium virtanenii]|uniref:Uncharacterized protein n=1 Tax=Acidipropionibacterium virtanenii TaxID=2057246 RepID=A0A344UQQ9_9ACTN|nr:hypothetical protein [Acidipropionibacterium virtanenii]AXE37607.1 hypothetical protein JS278_00411 [Acidipropionibacterium virtanenii]